jgi:hypothetical protein
LADDSSGDATKEKEANEANEANDFFLALATLHQDLWKYRLDNLRFT